MASDFTLKIKEAETEFWAPISKVKESENEFWAPISKVKEAERTSISKVQLYKKPKGRFRSPISKAHGFLVLHFEGSRCQRFSALPNSPGLNFEDFWLSGSSLNGIFNMPPGLDRISKVLAPFERISKSRLSFERTSKVLDFHLEELRRSWDFMLNISKVITSKFVTNISDFLFCFLFVRIEPTGTMFQTINNM
ncbi:uncharacterized protein OCT59_018281 [Rhizophagus irregularis]|uniref:uncharacterized protein n=1 Tax=Rhizophagus irregularis TaxID=588596 RepID=UPI00332C870A|nr:hypothetical protein OCT59_018281 [Rhizophagus irregularis]